LVQSPQVACPLLELSANAPAAGLVWPSISMILLCAKQVHLQNSVEAK
jgi:hypothetical protein